MGWSGPSQAVQTEDGKCGVKVGFTAGTTGYSFTNKTIIIVENIKQS